MINDGGDEEAREDRETPCLLCGHGKPSHRAGGECQRRMCECPKWEAMPPIDDTLAAIYIEAASRDRRCPECGSREINATETVCLACSNRAWSDR